MQERIERLRGEISRLKELAATADRKAAAELRTLARDMEKTVAEMQERLSATERAK